MPLLITNISGSVLDNFESEIVLIKSVSGNIESSLSMCGDYISVFGFISFTQNWDKLDETEELTKPMKFGLSQSQELITLEISY